MSGIQLPKRQSYVLPSVESFHILRAPPSSIHTRKKERVDLSDITYMIRNDDSRINESVNFLARGTNPMIDVSYNNMGGGSRTNTMPNIQASNPMKVIKDGAFRPPLFTQEDILPLSRQRRPETSAITNPGVRSGFNIHNLESQIDNGSIQSATNKEKINYMARPTAVYRMEIPHEVFSGHRMRDPMKISATAGYKGNQDYEMARDTQLINPMEASRDPLNVSATPNAYNPNNNATRDENIDINNYIKDNIILQNISPNFRIMLYDSNNKNYSEVFSSIKDKLNIAVQSSLNNPISLARSDGAQIKIKDYRWQIVTSAVGGDNLVILPMNAPDLQLERNMPLYAAGTNVSGNTKVERFHTVDPLMGDKVQSSAGSAVSMNYGRQDAIHDVERNMKLRGMGSVGGFNNMGSMPMSQKHDIPTLSSKNITVKQAAALEMGSRYNKY